MTTNKTLRQRFIWYMQLKYNPRIPIPGITQKDFNDLEVYLRQNGFTEQIESTLVRQLNQHLKEVIKDTFWTDYSPHQRNAKTREEPKHYSYTHRGAGFDDDNPYERYRWYGRRQRS